MAGKKRSFSQADMDAASDFLYKTQHDPYLFVMVAFPWGEKGGPLEAEEGPFEWQKEAMEYIKQNCSNRETAVRLAIASGNGIGKSAFTAWMILWLFSTYPDTRGVVTANTDGQLRTKTWAELNKWFSMFILKDFFQLDGTCLHSIDPGKEKVWRVDAIPWSVNNPEAMAGLHNRGKREFIIFDEASSIDSVIWETMEGAMGDADTEKFWLCFGNPTRKDGSFYDCFHKNRDVWKHQQVNSETVPSVTPAMLAEWRSTYGTDSDWYKIHVLGKFPSSNEAQFIPTPLVEEALQRIYDPHQFDYAPLILGVDMAWTGNDKVKIAMRQGLGGKLIKSIPYNDNDLDIAAIVAQLEDELKADAVFIDAGYGTGVYSAGQKWGRNWTLVFFNSKPTSQAYYNKRSEMYGHAKKWLQEGGAIVGQELADDLCAPELVWNDTGKIQLESKKEIKKRLKRSPDEADSFVLTFAYPVQKIDKYELTEPETEYDPWAGM